MKTSEQIDQVATALAKAQGAMKPALKDAINPAFRSKYADLAAVWEAWHAVGPANGIATVQDVTTEERGIAVVTRLLHSSGQWLEFGPLTVPLAKFDAHGVGSATSYAKRYGLSAAVGVVAEEDDDGNHAAQGAPPRRGRVDRSDETRAQQREESAENAPYRERELAKGAPLIAPPATPVPAPVLDAPPAPASDWPRLQERMKRWPAEIAALVPPDEALFLMPEAEAEANRELYEGGIRDMAIRRKLSSKEKGDLAEMFLGRRNASVQGANIYVLRCLWRYMDPERD